MKKYFDGFVIFIKKFYVLIILFIAYITITYFLNIPNCLVKLICGFPCPACGMTRAGFSILKLDIVSAFNYNPLIFLIPFLFLIIVFKDLPFLNKLYKNKILWISLLVLTIGIYIYRMIFIYPEYPMNYDSRNLFEVIKNLFSK